MLGWYSTTGNIYLATLSSFVSSVFNYSFSSWPDLCWNSAESLVWVPSSPKMPSLFYLISIFSCLSTRLPWPIFFIFSYPFDECWICSRRNCIDSSVFWVEVDNKPEKKSCGIRAAISTITSTAISRLLPPPFSGNTRLSCSEESVKTVVGA